MISIKRILTGLSALAFFFSSAQAMALDNHKNYLESGCVLPSFQTSSLENNEQGTAKVAILIGADGKVMDAKIQESSGYSNLDDASLLAVKGCTFKSNTEKGAQSEWADISVQWVLK